MALPVSAAAPNDPLYGRQWYMKQIHAEDAWKVTVGKPTVTVALIDSGVDIYHPDLLDAFWINHGELPGDGIDNDHDGFVDDVMGWNFTNKTGDVRPQGTSTTYEEVWSHGTATAALIAARQNDYIGITGIAPKVRIMPLVVLDGDGFGTIESTIEAINFAIAKKVDVINMSLAGYETDPRLTQALIDAEKAGIVVVAATGNDDNPDGADVGMLPVYPACSEKENTVIGVTGTDVLDQHAAYANYGSACTDIAAPGFDMLSAKPSNEPPGSDVTSTQFYLDHLTGTSLSSPLVAGVAALIKSVKPNWTPAQIRDRLFSTVDQIEEAVGRGQVGKLGHGRLDAGKALEGL